MDRQPSRARALAAEPALSPSHRAKLRRPIAAQHYVRRPRLLALLDDVALCPVTLVVAPAGAGKTSLIAGWAAEASTAVAWVSLDESDRDYVQFWSGVIAALETVVPACGSRARLMLRRPATRHQAVDQLLVDLDSSSPSPVVLAIDDVHLVDDDDAIATSVGRFLQDLPGLLHVIVLSRRDPELPIERMRSRGQLREIRFVELRFSRDEALELINRLAPALPEGGVEAAVKRADGWAASLLLVALAARSVQAQPDVHAPGAVDDALVHDYVLREVLADEAPAVIDALYAAAVMPRINASLARALTGRSDAGDLLVRAEKRGLFITRRGTGGWFELHGLVREVLTADLASHSPDRLAELHGRAAQWLEDTGDVIGALDQWVAAHRPRQALRLLAAQHARLYDEGREATVARTIAAIPRGVAASDVDALIDYAWCHVLVNRRRFLELVDELTWWVSTSTQNEAVAARVAMLQCNAALMSGRSAEGGVLARQAITDLGDGWWQDALCRFAWNNVAREVALSERWDDSGSEVRQAELALSRDPGRRLAFEGTRAVGLALAGHPLDALRVAAGVRHGADVANMTILRAELAIAEAMAHRELGDRTLAVAELEALADEPAETMLYCQVLATVELAYARLDGGHLDAAVLGLKRAQDLIERESFGPDGRDWLGRCGTAVALAGGNYDAARAWAEQLQDPFWQAVSCVRVHLATHDRAAATAALQTATPRCVRHEVVLHLLQARAAGDREEATACASTAVALAAANGLLQTVAAEGPEAIELVEHAAWRASAAWLDRLRRAAAETQFQSDLGAAHLVEPLTDRERDVLRFLPSRLTVREIADELYVSTNTVKFHLRVIYQKLGVNSRREAAELARRMSAVRSEQEANPSAPPRWRRR